MVRKPCVYQNVAMQMFIRGISISDLAKKSYTGYKALCRKLNGESSVTIEDAIAIHEALGKPMPIEILFSKELMPF